MGFSKDRGDSVSIANAPFTESEKNDSSQPIWKDPENISYAKDIFKYLLIAAILAFLYLKIIQPSLKMMFSSDGPSTAAGVAGAVGHIKVAGVDAYGEPGEEQVRIDHYGVKVQKARDIAQADPKAVANIIKDWIGANAS